MRYGNIATQEESTQVGSNDKGHLGYETQMRGAFDGQHATQEPCRCHVGLTGSKVLDSARCDIRILREADLPCSVSIKVKWVRVRDAR